MNSRPRSVTVIGWLFITAGTVGVGYHATEFKAAKPFDSELIWVLVVRLLAILGGAFMLRGRNWARWLMFLWMAYHIVLSTLHSLTELAMHVGLFGLIAWLLLRPPATAYFRGVRPASPRDST